MCELAFAKAAAVHSKTGLRNQIATHFAITKHLPPQRFRTVPALLLVPEPGLQNSQAVCAIGFFQEPASQWPHANFPRGNTGASLVFSPPARRHNLFARRGASPSRRHAVAASWHPHRWLLLPLRRIQGARRLREDVRVEEIRVSLVGHQLREASHEHTARRFPRRPTIRASASY